MDDITKEFSKTGDQKPGAISNEDLILAYQASGGYPHGDEAVAKELISQFRSYINNAAFAALRGQKKTDKNVVTIDDLVQVGRIGVLKAATTYDPALRGLKKYIYGGIENAVRKEIHSNAGLMPSTYIREIAISINAHENRISAAKGGTPLTQEEKAEVDRLVTLKILEKGHVVNIDTAANTIKNARNILQSRTVNKILPDGMHINSFLSSLEDTPFRETVHTEALALLNNAIEENLSERQKEVFLRMLGGETAEEIGADLNVSRQAVLQQRDKATVKLKNALSHSIENGDLVLEDIFADNDNQVVLAL